MELNLKTQQNKLISLFRVSLMFFLFFFVQQTVASSQSITLPSHKHHNQRCFLRNRETNRYVGRL